ncbi:sensor histidine kinase [Pseudonocardia nigra]|uniref:sensor histidine kinase n=1 Tax=Pseudonocardia nigra TaxID=1921578 RepID=UPI001C601FB3|nr:ATP-binding protein [Pseudonocardia nigra]
MSSGVAEGAAAGPAAPTGAVVAGRWDLRLGTVGYAVLLAACAALSLTWLTVGAVVAVAAHAPAVTASLAAAADGGSRWARGVLDAVPRSEPVGQAVLDYGFSLLTLAVALALPAVRARSWSLRLLVLAMIGSAGAFNLQAHAAAVAVQSATGLTLGGLHQVLLHGVACAAYVVALLVFPSGRDIRPDAGVARSAVVGAGVGSLLLVGFGTALLPHTVSCVLFFGFLVPLVGLTALPRRIRRGPTAAERTRARFLFSVLVAAIAVAIVLALITLLLWSIGWTGLLLVDPTAQAGPAGHAEPTALLFWFARLACVAIAAGALVAMRSGGLWTAERHFSRGLVAALVAALVGGGYIVVRAVVEFALGSDALVAAVLATVLAAAVLLPVHVRTEQLVDRLLYGTRPTPYSVLARIAALSRATATDAPDLAGVAEAVGRGLGATTARLTVVRPGLRDRTYTWSEPGVQAPDALVEVPVRYGPERIGTVAVDRAAVAGVHVQRQRLLEEIADSLGAVLQASRTGIELERQLRAVLAHANAIAVSRRAVVAEMDGERRRIERDLHDGAQHHLVSLRLMLGLVEHQVSTAQLDQAADRLDAIAGQIDTTESMLAETAAGVSSPLLTEAGLVTALGTELACGHPPVELEAGDLAEGARFPSDVEAAVYFCCLEAVNNARKHAPGAAIQVRLVAGDGRLHFTVHDEGPGWGQAASSATAGRGLRNVTARMAAVGGRIEIRSARGAGTTVQGWAPLPEPEPTRAPAVASTALLDRVRSTVGTARELYHGTASAGVVRGIAERLDGPLRVAVLGAAGSGASTLVEALTADGPAASTAVFELGTPATPAADALVLLMRPGHPGDAAVFSALLDGPSPHRPARAIGVLAFHAEPAGDLGAAEYGARPEVRRLCHVVVPMSGLREIIEAAFLRRADALKARSALLALEALVRAHPPGGDDAGLRYQLDRIRGGTHELTEIDLVDALRADELELPDADRRPAERLLGADGTQARVRLALAPDAGQEEVARAAAEELARWQRRAAHPMSTNDVRVVAGALVQTCEQLLAGVGLNDGTHRL